ncbi:tyrosine-type recombinase/integrase [Saccharothrix texasensis]|uniref:Site-specific recombinase XerD n=1 Tax=Saccharothrix texasensis TaxID=103734 RepID=A0A3N1HD47_9PSEU|nr:tyrosine-type recombinase/integrase [Saccharothrix texasensis]ROP40429.1 site-specific recombinase XerD [Saccharothrix texasensis]
MSTTYDVRIHQIGVYKGKRTTTYNVRWTVAQKRLREGFRVKALADSFRAELVTAARRGEAFDVDSGLPVSMRREQRVMSWYEFACAFVDMKWPRAAATTRRTNAEALTAASAALFTTDRGKPDDKLIRAALCRWGFNTNRRNDPNQPPEIAATLRWIERHTQPISALAKPEVLRPVLDGLTVRLDGQPYAPSVVNRRRKILSTAMEYAVERKLLPKNPVPALKWTAPKSVHAVDRRSVANPVQARTLLAAVGTQQRSGPRLVAFFGCLYFAAMRPEEAVALAKHNLSLPAEGWGELTIDTAEPHAGKEWTDSGANRDRRQLKQRARGETRTVPCPPELTALLHSHIRQFGTAADGRLFTGERNGQELPKLTIVRAWQRARAEVFTPEVAATPLAGTPYDLRHAAVSTWLNGGVPAVTVAEWAGHSVEVLLKIYAKCLDGEAVTVRQRVEAALGHRQG